MLLALQLPGFGKFPKEVAPEPMLPGRMTYSGTSPQGHSDDGDAAQAAAVRKESSRPRVDVAALRERHEPRALLDRRTAVGADLRALCDGLGEDRGAAVVAHRARRSQRRSRRGKKSAELRSPTCVPCTSPVGSDPHPVTTPNDAYLLPCGLPHHPT